MNRYTRLSSSSFNWFNGVVGKRYLSSSSNQFNTNNNGSGTSNKYLKELIGKNVLVTGGSRGIGKSIATELAEQGCNVTILSRNKETLEIIESFTTRYDNQTHHGIICDLSQPNYMYHLDNIFKKSNNNNNNNSKDIPIDSSSSTTTIYTTTSSNSTTKEPLPLSAGYDIIIHSAGITQSELFMRMSGDSIRTIMDVNALAPIYITKLLLKSMIAKRWGRIIFIGSVVGSMGNRGQAIYGASKQALVGFSKSLSLEVAPFNITSNIIAPGYIDTDMSRNYIELQGKQLLEKIPLGKIGNVNDITKSVLYLLESDYITGQVININGGLN